MYTVPSECDPPNEYDLVNARQSHGGQTKHVAEPAGDVTRCKMKDMLYCFIPLIAIVLSVIALVLVVVIAVTAIPNCSCNTSESNYQHFFCLSVGKSLGTRLPIVMVWCFSSVATFPELHATKGGGLGTRKCLSSSVTWSTN